MGYFEASKACSIYDPFNGKIHISRDMNFEEGGLNNHENGIEDTTFEFQFDEDCESPHHPRPTSPYLLATSPS